VGVLGGVRVRVSCMRSCVGAMSCVMRITHDVTPTHDLLPTLYAAERLRRQVSSHGNTVETGLVSYTPVPRFSSKCIIYRI
jgi:hypothetical protein